MWTIWSIIKCILMKFPQMYVEIWFTSSQKASFLYQRSMVQPRNEDNSSTISFFLSKKTSKELKAQFYSHLVE